jgi:fructose-1,6-bisphosphatase I
MIQREISKAGIVGLYGDKVSNCEGIYGEMNSSGDVQKKLDVISNEIMIDHLIHSKSCAILLSEENEEPIVVPEESRGAYIVAFDPLDGSSNIDCNCCIGTIFSISPFQNEILKNGRDLLCAGYVLYGPSTEMVIAFEKGKGVYRFILDHTIGEFIQIGKIQFPSTHLSKKIYSINQANSHHWPHVIQQYISIYHSPNTSYTLRYIGSMVADVHRTLLYGGNFLYPSDTKNKNGKLRILYECFPMAHIIEEAGGLAIVGTSNTHILDLIPTHIHEKTSIALGSTHEIDKLIKLL